MERSGRLTIDPSCRAPPSFRADSLSAQAPLRLAGFVDSSSAAIGSSSPAQPACNPAPPSQSDPVVKLKPAPLEPTDLRFPINLATALRLSDARPLIVAAAQASVWVAEAQLTRAKVLWVPQLKRGRRLHPARRRRTGFQ